MSPTAKHPGGRRPGSTTTRQQLLDVAVSQFAEHGYQGASLRAIGAEAGVDPGLVRHFFGGKQGLFREAVLQQMDLGQHLAGTLKDSGDELAPRLIEAYLSAWETEPSASTVRALFRAALESEENRQYLQDIIRAEAPLHGDLLPSKAAPGLMLAGSHLLGVCVVRYILRLEPWASMTAQEIITTLEPSIRQELQTTPSQR